MIVVLLVDLFDVIKYPKLKATNAFLVIGCITSLTLNYLKICDTWCFRPPYYEQYVDKDFIQKFNQKLNAKNKKIHGVSIYELDKSHLTFDYKQELFMIGCNWSTSYLNDFTYPTTFSKFYFREDGLQLLKNKKYITAFLKKQGLNSDEIHSQKQLIKLFIEKNDVDYLICDFNMDADISRVFKDTVRSNISRLRAYIR